HVFLLHHRTHHLLRHRLAAPGVHDSPPTQAPRTSPTPAPPLQNRPTTGSPCRACGCPPQGPSRLALCRRRGRRPGQEPLPRPGRWTLMWNWEFAAEALPILLRGFVNTLIATGVGTLIAVVLGLFIAVAIRGLPRWINWLIRLLVAFVLNTPLIMQLMFVYFIFAGIPGLVNIPALVVGFIVIGIHYSTYMSESYRAGIDAVPPGQHEAATALSLPPVRKFTAVVLPQALRATV